MFENMSAIILTQNLQNFYLFWCFDSCRTQKQTVGKNF